MENDAGKRREPLEAYLLERPALLLTFLEVAERYADHHGGERSYPG